MRRIVKIFFLAVLAVFLLIQFIRPKRNISTQQYDADLAKVYSVPPEVLSVLQAACYDCHSNNTHYPWYTNIQPVGLYLNKHIRHGKEELNFHEFGLYPSKRKRSKLRAMAEQIKDGKMPLSSYALLHKDARLTDPQKTALLNWIGQTLDSMRSP